MKRIATIQDFSCVGRCSLSVALPILSAAGVEACGIPTALLSNHTGMSSYYLRDLTEELVPVGKQLKALGITFDAIYTGYIASVEQMQLISDFIRDFRRENTLVFIDPVMGDEGRLYSGLTADYPERMRRLCRHADIITPNLTEACLLLGRDYIKNPTSQDFRTLAQQLFVLCAGKVVITGAVFDEGSHLTGALGFDGEHFYEECSPREDIPCYGTGDIFASSLIGAVMRGQSFQTALHTAVCFTYATVKLTAADPDRRSYGVNFEPALPTYISLLSDADK